MKSQSNREGGENQASGRPTKKQLQQSEDFHKMKEYYYDRYMNQLRGKMLDLDKKAATTSSAREPSQRTSYHSSSKKSSKSAESKERLTGIRRPIHKPVKMVIPKSKRLTMLEAEQKLTRAGLLQTADDLTEFRNGISSAEDLNQYTESFAAKKSQLQEQGVGSKKMNNIRPLSKITETRENSATKSRPATKSIPKKQMDTNMNPLGGNKNISPADIARAAAAALEKRCPRMDLPDLHCLRPESDDSDGETEIVQDQMRGRRRDEYASHVTYLRKMYQRAQANTAQAKRIIDNRDDDILQHDRREQLIYDLANVCDAMGSSTEYEPTERSSGRKRVNFYDMNSSTYDPAFDVPDISDTEEDSSLSEMQEDRLSQWREDSQQPSGTTRLTFNVFTPIEEEPTTPTLAIDQSEPQPPVVDQSQSQLAVSSNRFDLDPNGQQTVLAITDGVESIQSLNLHLIESELKTIEAKTMSTYWPNYLKVGKSKFAREESTL